MTGTSFDVTPEDLKRSATTIEEKTKDFITAYQSIYTAVSGLDVAYQGKSSKTFNQRIEGYKNDFEAAKTALENYVAFLKEYADSITGCENDLDSRAQTLSTGK